MKPEPNQAVYLRQWADLYEEKNYGKGLTGYFLAKSHEWAEKKFGPGVHIAKVLEVGSGTGAHLKAVQHTFDEYYQTDLNIDFLERMQQRAAQPLGRGKVVIRKSDAANLDFESDTFDRLIAAHVLEHLYRPHEVLREWFRVTRDGGTITLVLPCDPGVAWRLGRYLMARRQFVEAGFEYDYWMAREHVNAINSLVALLRYYFDAFDEQWLPLRVPSMDLNLFYIAHIPVRKRETHSV